MVIKFLPCGAFHDGFGKSSETTLVVLVGVLKSIVYQDVYIFWNCMARIRLISGHNKIQFWKTDSSDRWTEMGVVVKDHGKSSCCEKTAVEEYRHCALAGVDFNHDSTIQIFHSSSAIKT